MNLLFCHTHNYDPRCCDLHFVVFAAPPGATKKAFGLMLMLAAVCQLPVKAADVGRW